MTREYSNDWCTGHDQDWREVLAPFVGRPGVRFVEIGSYEGRSSVWFAEHVLTGEGAQILCVDPWRTYLDRPQDDMVAVEARFDRNVAGIRQIVKFKGTVADLFSPHFGRLADVIYIDGSHRAADVLTDSIFALQLLKIGGLLMWDDYSWRPDDGSNDCPALGIDAVLTVMVQTGRLEVVRSEKQLVVVRRVG